MWTRTYDNEGCFVVGGEKGALSGAIPLALTLLIKRDEL